jgi:hypothetical protein
MYLRLHERSLRRICSILTATLIQQTELELRSDIAVVRSGRQFVDAAVHGARMVNFFGFPV